MSLISQRKLPGLQLPGQPARPQRIRASQEPEERLRVTGNQSRNWKGDDAVTN